MYLKQMQFGSLVVLWLSKVHAHTCPITEIGTKLTVIKLESLQIQIVAFTLAEKALNCF